MMTRSPEDWMAVLEALMKNDREALAKVTALITGWLRRYRAYDHQDSWPDLIQEVLIKLMKAYRRGAIRKPSALVSYVGTTTRNALIDSIKPERPQGSWELPPPEKPPGAEMLLELQRAIEGLPEDLRQVLVMRYQGHINEEIATALGISVATQKRRLAQARKEISKKVSRE